MISEDTFHRIYVENGISYFLRTLKGVDFDTELYVYAFPRLWAERGMKIFSDCMTGEGGGGVTELRYFTVRAGISNHLNIKPWVFKIPAA
jgi:hypothetical protein